MRLLALDTETTGFDFETDRIIELGYALWEDGKILATESKFVYRDGFPSSDPMAFRAHGISEETLKEFGFDPKDVFMSMKRLISLWRVDFIVGHNIKEFDIPFLKSDMNKEGLEIFARPMLDTRCDLPFEVPPDSNKLKYMAADFNFLNPFPHRALFDALTCLKVLEKFDLTKVIEYSLIPSITIEAKVSYDTREKARARKFFWAPKEKKWLKKIKESELSQEISLADFKIEVIK